MRTLLYARFSSHLQNSKSIADQISLLSSRAEREGWQIVEVFTDHAISGAAGIDDRQRPGLAAMLDRLDRGDIDQVFAESTDRLARHEGDAFAIRERINFTGARLFTLNDGVIDEITGTIKGLMDSRFRKELGAKTKRGMFGTVNDGRAPAGKAYGYRIANRLNEKGVLIRGLREIDEAQADVVRRIFTEYAAGRSSRAIAADLNKDGIAGPSGGKWRLTTIHGDRQRQNGMLQNELYRGVRVYNRTSKVVDPATRKTLIRPNPESEWQRHDVPELRIVSDELWNDVQRQRRSYAPQQPQAYRRPQRLFSGLLKCSVCGGGWIVVNRSYTGCGRHRDGGGCSNGHRMRIDVLERRILSGLSEEFMRPELIDEYVAEYRRAIAEWRRTSVKLRGQAQVELRKTIERTSRLVEALAEGEAIFDEIKDALIASRTKKLELEARIADLTDDNVVEIFPNIAENYRKKWSDLHTALRDEKPDGTIATAIRAMVDRVEISPPIDGSNELGVEVFGKLADILAFASGRKAAPKCTTTVERVTGIIRCSA